MVELDQVILHHTWRRFLSQEIIAKSPILSKFYGKDTKNTILCHEGIVAVLAIDAFLRIRREGRKDVRSAMMAGSGESFPRIPEA